MSTELTKAVYDNPHGEQILNLLLAIPFSIGGKYAGLRTKSVHISGHLPVGFLTPMTTGLATGVQSTPTPPV